MEMPNFCTNITPICAPKKICSIITISTPKNIFFPTPIVTPTPPESKSGFRTPCSSLLTVYESSELFYLSAIIINVLST
jgi:hypothetical protein